MYILGSRLLFSCSSCLHKSNLKSQPALPPSVALPQQPDSDIQEAQCCTCPPTALILTFMSLFEHRDRYQGRRVSKQQLRLQSEGQVRRFYVRLRTKTEQNTDSKD